MTGIGLARVRLADAWGRMFATSRPWVLAVYSVLLPVFWIGCLRIAPGLLASLDVYDGGELALAAAALAPCLWLALFSQRIYQMPSRAGAWMTHDFHFLLAQPLPLHKILVAMATVWTLGDLPVAISTSALVMAFLTAIKAPPALAILGMFGFFWMVWTVFLILGLARLLFHQHTRWLHRVGMAALAGLVVAAFVGGLAPAVEPDTPRAALAWIERPMPRIAAVGVVEKSVAALEPMLDAYRRIRPVAAWLPPVVLYRGVSKLAVRDTSGWWWLGGLAALLLAINILILRLAEPLARADRLALVPGDAEEPEPRKDGDRLEPERWLTGLDAKEIQLWRRFWTGPVALACLTGYMSWYLLKAGYGILAAAKLLGMASWMIGSLAGDSLGWERKGLVLCRLLPLEPAQMLAAKARWAALVGMLTLVVPFAVVGVAIDAEPFAELLRGTLVLTFLVFVAAHAGVAMGALLRDLNGELVPGMGPLLGGLLWLVLCGAMVAQVFFASGYAVFGGLFFDLMLVAALWQRACVQIAHSLESEEVVTEETTFADAILVFLSAYLMVAVIVLKAQAMGASTGALSALRAYLLTALFPLVLAALTWVHLRLLKEDVKEARRPAFAGSRLAWGLATGCATVTMSLAYSWGATRLGWLTPKDLGIGVKMMNQMFEGLPLSPLLMFFLMGLLAPIAEEGFFRGLFYKGIRRFHSADYRVAVLLSSLAFGLMHPAAHFPVIFTMGLFYSLLVELRGGLFAAMVAHGFHNTVMLAIFLSGRF